MAGDFTGTVDFDPGNTVTNLVAADTTDCFIMKLSLSGNLLWAKNFGGISSPLIDDMKIGPLGNVCFIGRFSRIADFDPGVGTYNLTSNGYQDIFISKLDASGNFVWAKQIGGIEFETVRSIAVDGNGNVYTIGEFISPVDFDPGNGTYILSPSISGLGNIYISKLE